TDRELDAAGSVLTGRDGAAFSLLPVLPVPPAGGATPGDAPAALPAFGFALEATPPGLPAGAPVAGGVTAGPPVRDTATGGAPGLASASFGISTVCASASTLIVLVADHGARPGARAVIVYVPPSI